jgi:hypothetical protein
VQADIRYALQILCSMMHQIHGENAMIPLDTILIRVDHEEHILKSHEGIQKQVDAERDVTANRAPIE